MRYFILKNSPKTVAEFMYTGVDNINNTPLNVFASLENYTFNEAGDQVEYKLSTQGQSISNVTRYEKDGYSVVWKNGREDRLATDFKKIGVNQFLQTNWLYPTGKSTQVVTYADSGNSIRKEEIYEDSADQKKAAKDLVFTTIYDGQLPLKQTWKPNDGGPLTTMVYFYSAKKQLDSTVYSTGTSQHFINNKQGDPVEEYNVTNADTTYHFIRTYTYDEKGNWIRMLKHRLPDRWWTGKPPKDANPFTLYVRKISY